MNKDEWRELENEVDMEKIWEEVDEDRKATVGEPRQVGDIDTTQYAERYRIARDRARKLFQEWHDTGHPKWDSLRVWDPGKKRSIWVIRMKKLP